MDQRKKAELLKSYDRAVKVVDRLGTYAADPSQLVKDVEKARAEALAALERAKESWESFRKWLDTPINRAQSLLDSGRQPRMPWRTCMHGWRARLFSISAATSCTDGMQWSGRINAVNR